MTQDQIERALTAADVFVGLNFGTFAAETMRALSDAIRQHPRIERAAYEAGYFDGRQPDAMNFECAARMAAYLESPRRPNAV